MAIADAPDPSAEADLVAGLRSGDSAAFTAVYDRHAPTMFRFLVRLCGRRDLAEDLFQELWMRVARHGRRLRPDTRLGPWLYTVARNLVRSHARWSVGDAAGLAALASWWYLEAPASAPLEAVLAADAARRLEAGIARLPASGREVLLLVVVEGLSVDDAARVLKLTSEAARQRLHRARAELLRCLPMSDGEKR
ncbi:MAG TPA: RNA polymerase sigma factor [Polyangia bacterium]|nr:RNA polymerase sigma factor [Polyangia bacterium]